MRKLYKELATAHAVQEPRRRGSTPNRKDQLVPTKSMPSARRSKFKSTKSITVDFNALFRKWEQPEAFDSSTDEKPQTKGHAVASTPIAGMTNSFSNTFNPFDLGWDDEDGEDVSVGWDTNEAKDHDFKDGCSLFENSFSQCSDTEHSYFSRWTQSTSELTASPQKNEKRNVTNSLKESSSKPPPTSTDSCHIKGVSLLDHSPDESSGRKSKLHNNGEKISSYFPFEDVSCGSSLSSSNRQSWDNETREREDDAMRLLVHSTCSSDISSQHAISPTNFPVECWKRSRQPHLQPVQSSAKQELNRKSMVEDQQLPFEVTGKECQSRREQVLTDTVLSSSTKEDYHKICDKQFSPAQNKHCPIFTCENSQPGVLSGIQAHSQAAVIPGKKTYLRVPSSDRGSPAVVSKGKLAGTTLASVMERRRKIADGLCPTETKSTTVEMATKDYLCSSQVSSRLEQNGCQRSQSQVKSQDQIPATGSISDVDPGNLLSVPECDQNYVLAPVPVRKSEYDFLSTIQGESCTKPDHHLDLSVCNESPVPNSKTTTESKDTNSPNDSEKPILESRPECNKSHTDLANSPDPKDALENYQKHDQTQVPQPEIEFGADFATATEYDPVGIGPVDVLLKSLPSTPDKLCSPPENECIDSLEVSKSQYIAKQDKDEPASPTKESPVPVDESVAKNVTSMHTQKEEIVAKDFQQEDEQSMVKSRPETKESCTDLNRADENDQKHDQTQVPPPDSDSATTAVHDPVGTGPLDVLLKSLPSTLDKLCSPPENECIDSLEASKSQYTKQDKEKTASPAEEFSVLVDEASTNGTSMHTQNEEIVAKDFQKEDEKTDSKYLKMIQIGLPTAAVKNALQRDGNNPGILDQIKEPSDVESAGGHCQAKHDSVLVDDPKYAKYFRMLKLGLPLGAVKNAMERDGMNPAVLDGDHEISAENSAVATKRTLLCDSKPKDTHRRTRLYWDTLDEVQPHSVWAMVEQDPDVRQICINDINDDEFAHFFQAELGPSLRNTNQKASRSSLKGVVKVIDPQRANNGGIILARLRMSYDSMAKAVDCIDESAIDLNQIQGVMEYIPTDEEKKALRSYMAQPDSDAAFSALCECEKFMVTMMKVKHSKRKIRALLFKLQLGSNIKEIEKDVVTVEKACEELSSSVRLRKLLGIILNIGNRLNTAGQPQKSEAQAFTIQSLLKLNQVKAFDRKTTLLQYIVMVIHRNNELILRIRDELPTVMKADRIDWKQCLTDLQKLEIEIVNTRRIALHQALRGTSEKRHMIDDSDSMSETSLSLQRENEILRSSEQGQFTLYAFEKLSMLRDNVERTKRKYSALLEYFGEENNKRNMQPHELFQIINAFCKDIENTRKEVSNNEKAKETKLKENKDHYQENEGSIKVPIQEVMKTIQSQSMMKKPVQFTPKTNAVNLTGSKNKSIGKFIWRRRK